VIGARSEISGGVSEDLGREGSDPNLFFFVVVFFFFCFPVSEP
jgi:hypothetical protein